MEFPVSLNEKVYFLTEDKDYVCEGMVIGYIYENDAWTLVVTHITGEPHDYKGSIRRWFTSESEAYAELSDRRDVELLAIKKLDQKNRLHIPYKHLEVAGIEPNSEVFVCCNVRTKDIIIRRKR